MYIMNRVCGLYRACGLWQWTDDGVYAAYSEHASGMRLQWTDYLSEKADWKRRLHLQSRCQGCFESWHVSLGERSDWGMLGILQCQEDQTVMHTQFYTNVCSADLGARGGVGGVMNISLSSCLWIPVTSVFCFLLPSETINLLPRCYYSYYRLLHSNNMEFRQHLEFI